MKPNRQPGFFAALAAFDDISVSRDTIRAYLAFLLNSIHLPCEVLTAGEYERYQLMEILDTDEELFGLLGKVALLENENKQLLIPLCDLSAVDNRTENFKLLSDYADWFINHQ